MGTFEADYSEVEVREGGGGYDGDLPARGIYDAELVECDEHDGPSGEGTQWVFEITEEPYEGWRGWVYTNPDGAAWKESQILVAIGVLKDPNGSIKTTHEKILKKAKPCRIKIKHEKFEGEPRAKISVVLPKDGSSSKKKGKKQDDDDDF